MGYKDIDSNNDVAESKIDLKDWTIYASYEVDKDGKIIFSADD